MTDQEIQEQAEKILKECKGDSCYIHEDDSIGAMNDLAKWMQERNKWISVKDQLPKKYQSVQIAFKGKMKRVKGKVCNGWWNGEYWDCYEILIGLNEKITVTHWMPLPSPPKD